MSHNDEADARAGVLDRVRPAGGRNTNVLEARDQWNIAAESPSFSRAHPRIQTHVRADTSCARTLDELAQLLHRDVNLLLWVNWKALELAPDTPIDCQLKGLTAERALDRLVEQMSRPGRPVRYRAVGNAVTISSKRDLDMPEATRVFDVRELLLSHPAAPEQATAELCGFVTQEVEPDTWKVHGGDGSLREMEGQLIVCHNKRALVRVAYVLEMQRWKLRIGRVTMHALPMFIATFIGSALTMGFISWHRTRSRAGRGLCVTCGYDLRSSSSRCPECGAVAIRAPGVGAT